MWWDYAWYRRLSIHFQISPISVWFFALSIFTFLTLPSPLYRSHVNIVPINWIYLKLLYFIWNFHWLWYNVDVGIDLTSFVWCLSSLSSPLVHESSVKGLDAKIKKKNLKKNKKACSIQEHPKSYWEIQCWNVEIAMCTISHIISVYYWTQDAPQRFHRFIDNTKNDTIRFVSEN